jgi:L-alanine-DL-glutamate epimerase-like enolase superfamily enzyme
LFIDGGLDWVQPDSGRIGISNFVAAGRIAADNDCKVVNHSFKSGITISASLNALSVFPDAEICEFCLSYSATAAGRRST